MAVELQHVSPVVLPKGRDANRLVYEFLTATEDRQQFSALRRLVNYCGRIAARHKLYLPGKIGYLSTSEDKIGRGAESLTRWFIEEEILAWLRPWRAKSDAEIAEKASQGYFQIIERAVRHKLVDTIRQETTTKLGHSVLVRGEDGKITYELPTIYSLNVPVFGEDESAESEGNEERLDQIAAKGWGSKQRRGNRRKGPNIGGSPFARRSDVEQRIALYFRTVRGLPNPQRSPAALLAEFRAIADGKPLSGLRSVLWKPKPFPPLYTYSSRGSETWPVPAPDDERHATKPASTQPPKVLWYWLDAKRCVECAPTPPTVYTSLEGLRDWKGNLPREVPYSLDATVECIPAVATGEEDRDKVLLSKDRRYDFFSRVELKSVGAAHGEHCSGFEQPTYRDNGTGVQPLPSLRHIAFRIGQLQDRYGMTYQRAAVNVLADSTCRCGGCSALGTDLQQQREWEGHKRFPAQAIASEVKEPWDRPAPDYLLYARDHALRLDDKANVWVLCWPCPRKSTTRDDLCWLGCEAWGGHKLG
jgi:hypothetical protein